MFFLPFKGIILLSKGDSEGFDSKLLEERDYFFYGWIFWGGSGCGIAYLNLFSLIEVARVIFFSFYSSYVICRRFFRVRLGFFSRLLIIWVTMDPKLSSILEHFLKYSSIFSILLISVMQASCSVPIPISNKISDSLLSFLWWLRIWG